MTYQIKNNFFIFYKNQHFYIIITFDKLFERTKLIKPFKKFILNLKILTSDTGSNAYPSIFDKYSSKSVSYI